MRTRITAGVRLSVLRSAEPSDQSSTGEPVISRPQEVQEDRNSEIGMVGSALESTTLETDNDTESRSAMLLNAARGRWLPDRLRQPDYLPPGSVPKDVGRRLSALRPYLTAGLPLSVQSILKELPLVQVGQTELNIRRNLVSITFLCRSAGEKNRRQTADSGCANSGGNRPSAGFRSRCQPGTRGRHCSRDTKRHWR